MDAPNEFYQIILDMPGGMSREDVEGLARELEEISGAEFSDVVKKTSDYRRE